MSKAMGEAFRVADNGTEQNPYGQHSICRACHWGRLQTRVVHEWRSRLDPPPDPMENPGPIRTYHTYSLCLHPTLVAMSNGIAVHPEYTDVAACEMFKQREV